MLRIINFIKNLTSISNYMRSFLFTFLVTNETVNVIIGKYDNNEAIEQKYEI